MQDQPALIAAVFDVDRTLIPGTTTERLFIRYLLRRRVIGLTQIAQLGWYVLRALPKMDPMEAVRRQRIYLAGLPVRRVVPLAEACFREEIQPRISPAGIAAVREHKAQGHMTVLLSGSLDFLLHPLQSYLQANHLIATHMEERNGRFTGRIEGPWPYGPTKAVLIRHFAEEHGVAFADSYAYADHHSDVEVLSLFGRPVVINAKAKMAALARERQWEMREFR
jgi:putative phosphoserine phosphatase/1-acylglycerol-3-phosphate O-acyltransferase